MIVSALSQIISKIKGEKFILDPKIPKKYLLSYFYHYFIQLIWGGLVFRKWCFVAPSTVIRCKSKIRFGKNFRVASHCYIDALSDEGLCCGDNVSIGYNTYIELSGNLKKMGKGIKIGNNVFLGDRGRYGSGMGLLIIGDDTLIGNYVSFHPENHNYSDSSKLIRLQGVNGKGIIVGKNCWIGAKVTILDGTRIGDGCIVAAGAVVTGVFPNNVIIGGIPAKIIKYRS